MKSGFAKSTCAFFEYYLCANRRGSFNRTAKRRNNLRDVKAKLLVRGSEDYEATFPLVQGETRVLRLLERPK